MSTSVIRSDWAGQVVDGRFPLLQWLGGSESSGVFLTELSGDPPQKAAIKLIPADAGEAKGLVAGWAAAAGLSHAHLMHLFRTGRSRIDNTDILYVVTEYADENLGEIIPQRPLTPAETRDMLDPVLDALAYLHAKGFVHGHVKPSNLMGVDNQLKLSSDRLYLAGQFWEHFPAPGVYDAPETATQMSTAADSWSLGVTLVEALTQQPPRWDKATGADPVVPESMPQPFAEIARECLRRDPSRRWTIDQVKARLASRPGGRAVGRVAAGAEFSGRRFSAAQETDKPASRKIPVPTIVAAVAALLVAIAVVRFTIHKSMPAETAVTTAPGPAAAQNPPAEPEPAQPSPPQSPIPTHPAPRRLAVKATPNGAVVERVMPNVPAKASATIHGTVRVAVRVAADANGNVSNATLASPGPSHYFADLALEASRHWKFKPAQGPSSWILHYEFRQSGVEVAPVQGAS